MADLITLDYFKTFAKLDRNNSTVDTDAALAQWITGASDAFVTLTNRACIAATQFTDTVSGDGSNSLFLRRTPIVSVQSISVGGLAIPAYTSGPAQGFVLDDNGFSLVMVNGSFAIGQRNVVINYTAGYDPVPSDIQELVAEMVQMKRVKFPRIDKVSDNLPTAAGQTTSFSQRDLPPLGMEIVNRYKTIVRGYSR